MDAMDGRAVEIKEKLAGYSAETGNTSFYGAEHYATVSTSTSVSVPKLGSEPRIGLEAVLKAFRLWEQVDQLSSSKLKKLADSGALTDEQREAVNKYLERSESSRVGLRKRKTRKQPNIAYIIPKTSSGRGLSRICSAAWTCRVDCNCAGNLLQER